jgi:hypothetical protein
MDSLEYVVRPYQTPSAHGAIIIPSTPTGTRERATLTWGAEATMPEREEPDGIGFQLVCCTETLNENSRETETKRIEQEGNPDNWVDVDRPTKLKLKKKDANKCGDVWDQISGVEQQVNSVLSMFNDAIHSGTAGKKDKNCNVSWNFKNQ